MYWITGFLGATFAVAPFLLGYSDNTTALWTSVVLGGITVVVSYLEATVGKSQRWEYWVAGFIGIAAIAAPYIFGYGNVAPAMLASVVIGLLLAFSSVSELFIDKSSTS